MYKSHFNNENKKIVVIDRLTYRKKLEQLFDALQILKSKGLKFNITLVGDGEAESYLEDLAKTKGISELIWFYGACYSENKNAEIMYNADLCVTPGDIGLTAVHSFFIKL